MRRKTIITAALGAFASIALSSAAAAAPTGSVDADFDASRDPEGIGIAGALGTPDSPAAGMFYMRVEGEVVRVFCVQPDVEQPTDRRVEFTADKYSNLRDGDASRLTAANWFMRHQTYGLDGHPTGDAVAVGTPINGRDGIPAAQVTYAEAATAQMAIWNYVNGTDYSQVRSNRAKARVADYLSYLSDPANRIAEGAHDFELVANLADDNLTVITYGYVGDGKAPLIGVPVTITSATTDLDPTVDGIQNEVTASSDTTGTITIPGVPADAADVSAKAEFILPAGTLLTDHDGDAQQVMTVDPARIYRTVSAAAPAAPAVPAGEPLPHTGGTMTWLLLALSGLAGAAGFATLRRNPA